MLDISRPFSPGDHELITAVKAELINRPGTKALIALNKQDISRENFNIELAELAEILPEIAKVSISAQHGDNLAELEEKLATLAVGSENLAGRSLMITNSRHRRALERARESLVAGIESSAAGLPADFTSIDLRLAMEALGEITGESVQESLLHEIFSNFCIGK